MISNKMSVRSGALAAFAALALTLSSAPYPAYSQTPDPKAAEQKPADAGKRDATPKRIDEIAEISRQQTGPAANPECIWLGRRVVSLLLRDDLDTAFRHLDLYDRFGCPGGHIQATFRCLVRHSVDPKAQEATALQVNACWINPSLQPAPPAAATAAQPSGTTSR